MRRASRLVHRDLKATLLAGPLAGLVGVLLFTLFHALLVKPAPWLLVAGPLAVAPGSLLGAWAWHAVRRRGDGARLPGAALGGILALALVPVGLIPILLGPIGSTDEGPEPGARSLVFGAVALGVLLAAGAGGAWSRSWRGALALATAALATALPFAMQVASTDLLGRFGVFYLSLLLTLVLVGVAFARVQARLAARWGAAA